MKRYFALLALGASLLPASSFGAPGQPAPAPQKLVRVATLRTIEANREFQANVQLLRAQRDAMIQLTAEVEKEKDPAKKRELKTKLDQLTATLNANNEKAQKLYGFSLARNYTMEIEVSHIYMILTEAEAAKLEQEQRERAKAAPTPK